MFSGMLGLKFRLAPPLWRLLERTIRLVPFKAAPDGSAGPVIFACLHRDLLPAIMYVKTARPALMISNSPDGEILVQTLGHQNYRFVRGASGQDGGRAFVAMRRMLADGVSVGVTVDGPDGPFGKIHDGVLQLAKMTGSPILPLVAHTSRALVLNTWDRTVVPLPFSKVKMVTGPVLQIPAAGDSEELNDHRAILEEFFQVGEQPA